MSAKEKPLKIELKFHVEPDDPRKPYILTKFKELLEALGEEEKERAECKISNYRRAN